MRHINLPKFKIMKNKFLLLALLIVPSIFMAQVGVGTTSVNPSAKFQIDATNKGFLQPRVALTGTADASTIVSPATGLMVFNTASAGTAEAAVTPGVYYYGGTAWKRLADQTAATATTTTIVNGNLGSQFFGGGEYIAPGPGLTKTFGASITLPPGKWEVILNLYFNINQFNAPVFINEVETAYWLTDTNSATAMDYSFPSTPTDITADVLLPGGGQFSQRAGVGGLGSVHKGSFFINNSTAGNKTYYLSFHEGGYTDFENVNGGEPTYTKLGGNSWTGNRFYAVKIN
jgi:hypothetical protein